MARRTELETNELPLPGKASMQRSVCRETSLRSRQASLVIGSARSAMGSYRCGALDRLFLRRR